MKHFNIVKILCIVSLLSLTQISRAQTTAHPLSFGSYNIGTFATGPNWYANYVGVRLEVISPASIAGDKNYSIANNNSGGTSEWGAPVTTPIVDVQVFKNPLDSGACGTGDETSAASMTGKIALIWRGPPSSPCEFGWKAQQAQDSGAVACIIVNDVSGPPVGMAAGTYGGGVTIPVLMINQTDGAAIDSVLNAGGTVNMTLTPWGLGNKNDLGFIPQGAAGWHSYAIPSNQLVANGNPVGIMGYDGAFVANYGSQNATNVKLVSSLSFTPSGGSPSIINEDSVTLSSFTSLDSIYAMFAPSQYNVSLSTPTDGQFTINYTISSDSVDQYPEDNTVSYSFYATDSVYSMGRYDFANQVPYISTYEAVGSNDFIWGPVYYTPKGGTAISTVQFSIVSNTPGPISASFMNVFIFKWIDSSNSYPKDSLIQVGELNLVGIALETFGGAGDTSGAMFKVTVLDTNYNPNIITLDSSSWYYIGCEVPGSYFLGIDGVLDMFPRQYGRQKFQNYKEYSCPVYPGDRIATGSSTNPMNFYPATTLTIYPFPELTSINSPVDSVVYTNQIGLIPAVPIYVNNHPTSVNTVSKPFADITIYPNPASNQTTASVTFPSVSSAVTYTILDGWGRIVSKEIHYNVQSEKYNISTSNFALGNYYLIINANNKVMSRKFAVIR